jgi:hypothetical protein
VHNVHGPVTVKEVVATQQVAEAEVERLDQLGASVGRVRSVHRASTPSATSTPPGAADHRRGSPRRGREQAASTPTTYPEARTGPIAGHAKKRRPGTLVLDGPRPAARCARPVVRARARRRGRTKLRRATPRRRTNPRAAAPRSDRLNGEKVPSRYPRSGARPLPRIAQVHREIRAAWPPSPGGREASSRRTWFGGLQVAAAESGRRQTAQPNGCSVSHRAMLRDARSYSDRWIAPVIKLSRSVDCTACIARVSVASTYSGAPSGNAGRVNRSRRSRCPV